MSSSAASLAPSMYSPHPPRPQELSLLDEADYQFLCLRRLSSLQHDTALWDLLLRPPSVSEEVHTYTTGEDNTGGSSGADDNAGPFRIRASGRDDEGDLHLCRHQARQRQKPWPRAFYALASHSAWTFDLLKVERRFCRARAVHVRGPPAPAAVEREATMVVRKRLPLSRLHAFVSGGAPVLYLEAADREEQNGFQTFVDYLADRGRAGVVFLPGWRVFVFPPCPYARERLGYRGLGLLAQIVPERQQEQQQQQNEAEDEDDMIMMMSDGIYGDPMAGSGHNECYDDDDAPEPQSEEEP